MLNLDVLNLDVLNLDVLNLDVLNLDVLNLDVLNLDVLNLDVLNLDVLNLDVLNYAMSYNPANRFIHCNLSNFTKLHFFSLFQWQTLIWSPESIHNRPDTNTCIKANQVYNTKAS